MFFKKLLKILKQILYSFRYANIRLLFCENDCDCIICCKRYSDTYPPDKPCTCETIKPYIPERNDPCSIM